MEVEAINNEWDLPQRWFIINWSLKVSTMYKYIQLISCIMSARSIAWSLALLEFRFFCWLQFRHSDRIGLEKSFPNVLLERRGSTPSRPKFKSDFIYSYPWQPPKLNLWERTWINIQNEPILANASKTLSRVEYKIWLKYKACLCQYTPIF